MVRHEERTRWATTQGQARLSIEVPSKQALGSAANLVEQTWYSRMPRTVQAVCGEIELSHHLEYATYVRVAMLDDGFAGIVAAAPTSAYRHHNPESVSALWFRDHTHRTASPSTEPRCEAAIAAALAPVTAEMVLSQDFLKSNDDRAAWELTLLAVEPKCHGNGIGRALFASALSYLREQGAPGFFLATDDGCDFGFYDHLGLTRIAEREVPDCLGTGTIAPANGAALQKDERHFHVYLYGARLGDLSDACR